MNKQIWLKGTCVAAALLLNAAIGFGEEAPAAPAPGTVAPAAPAPAPAPAPVPPAPPAVVYGWAEEINTQVGLAQSHFDNWSQGGEDSLTWQGSFLGKATDDESDYNWATTLKLAFGQIKSGTLEVKKSTDEINLESVLTYKLGIHVDPYAACKAITQFTTGYDYSGPEKVATSNFMDPGYLVESLGVGYTTQEIFKTRLGFAVRETVTKTYNQYADDPTTVDVEKTKVEPGMESVTEVTLKLSDNMRFGSNLSLFSNLKASDQIVARWDNALNISLSKYITAGVNLQLLYDKSVSTRRQLSQAMTLGLAYQFANKPAGAGK